MYNFNMLKKCKFNKIINICFFMLLFFSMNIVNANNIPSENILKQLKERMVKDTHCENKCYTLMDTFIIINEDFSEVRLEFNVSENEQVVPLLRDIEKENILDNYLISKINEINFEESPVFTFRENNNVYALLNKGRNIILLKKVLNEKESFSINLHDSPLRKEIMLSNNWKEVLNQNGRFRFERFVSGLNEKTDKKIDFKIKETKFKPLIKIERDFYFYDDWIVKTKVYSLNNTKDTINFPLLDGEKVKGSFNIKDNSVLIDVNERGFIEFESILDKKNNFSIRKNLPSNVLETWSFNVSTKYDVNYSGINIINKYTYNNYNPVWMPKEAEELRIIVSLVDPKIGNDLTLLKGNLNIKKGDKINDIDLLLKINSSLSKQHSIKIPENIEVVSIKNLSKDSYEKVIRNDEELLININSGINDISIKMKEKTNSVLFYKTPKIDLNMEGVNNFINIKLDRNRWLLYTSKADLHPNILLWGIIVFSLIISFVVSKIIKKPLSLLDWILIGIGTAFTNIYAFIMFIFLISYFYFKNERSLIYRGQSIVSIIFYIIMILIFVTTISIGLLSEPNMTVMGLNSNKYSLNWYQDTMIENYLEVSIIEINLLIYKILILLWSLWIANSIVKWSKWIWNNFIEDDKKLKELKTKK